MSKNGAKSIGTAMDSQDGYGFDKYGKPLEHTDTRYNWLAMFKEEIADGLKYIECEENRKKDVILLLENSIKLINLEPDINPHTKYALLLLVEEALKLLKIQGTGK